MAITLPSFVAPNELIQSAWGNGVVNALYEIDTEKLNNNASDTMTGTLTLQPTGTSTGLIIKNDGEAPRAQWQSVAGTALLDIKAEATGTTIDTVTSTPIDILTRVTMESQSGSTVLALSAVTDTPVLVLESVAGTGLLTLTAGVTNSTISAFDDLTLRSNGNDVLVIDGTTRRATFIDEVTIGGEFDHNGSTVGFYGTTPIAKQTGVAVTAAAIHAALVALGLIGA